MKNGWRMFRIASNTITAAVLFATALLDEIVVLSVARLLGMKKPEAVSSSS